MQPEPRNPNAPRPDLALRWAGRVLLLTALALITDLALQPGYEMPTRLFGSDKLEHVGAFFVLTLLARLSFPRLPLLIPTTILMLYGIWIEYMQSLPHIGRTASIADAVADLVGILLAALMIVLVERGLASRADD